MKKILSFVLVVLLLIGASLAFAATVSVDNNDSRDHATGSITADGSSVTVPIGWTPTSIVISKVTNTLGGLYWVKGMAADSGIRSTNTGTSGQVIVSVPTVSCITIYSGSTTTAPGFTVGADTVINISGDTLRFEATR